MIEQTMATIKVVRLIPECLAAAAVADEVAAAWVGEADEEEAVVAFALTELIAAAAELTSPRKALSGLMLLD